MNDRTALELLKTVDPVEVDELRRRPAPREQLEAIMAKPTSGTPTPPAPRFPDTRRRWRLVAGVATTTAAVGLALTALPGSSPTPEPTPALSGAVLLQTASAVAAAQPEPPASAGYRYTETLERWRWSPSNAPIGPTGKPVRGTEETVEIEQRVETWIDREGWSGRRVAHRGRVIAGDAKTGSPSACGRHGTPMPLPAECGYYHLLAPSDSPWGYGGEGEAVGPIAGNVDVAELPTEARGLRRVLLHAYRSANWAPGHPTPEQERYDLVKEVLLMLQSANTTPDLRAALWGILALAPGVEAAPAASDPLGRSGEAVAIPVRPDGGGGVIMVIFDPRTSELLFWSERGTGDGTPEQSHTIMRAGHVGTTTERPRG